MDNPGSRGESYFLPAVKDHHSFLFFSSTTAQYRYLPAALASTHVYDHTAYNDVLVLGMEPEKQEELLWFFRREDRKSHRCFWVES